ncbi:hypothetical protein L9F63_016784, partial [Diploptera punctata]
ERELFEASRYPLPWTIYNTMFFELASLKSRNRKLFPVFFATRVFRIRSRARVEIYLCFFTTKVSSSFTNICGDKHSSQVNGYFFVITIFFWDMFTPKFFGECKTSKGDFKNRNKFSTSANSELSVYECFRKSFRKATASIFRSFARNSKLFLASSESMFYKKDPTKIVECAESYSNRNSLNCVWRSRTPSAKVRANCFYSQQPKFRYFLYCFLAKMEYLELRQQHTFLFKQCRGHFQHIFLYYLRIKLVTQCFFCEKSDMPGNFLGELHCPEERFMELVMMF